MKRIILTLVMTAALTGCVQPRYKRPAMPVAPQWPTSAATDMNTGVPEAADVKWEDFFTDEKLRSVLKLALENNRDLRIAALNVERVQALYRIQRAQQVPNVGAAAEGQVYRVPRNLSPNGQAYNSEQYTVGLGVAGWELDLFGRVRSLKNVALQQYLASQQARSGAQISLVAAVANTYLTLAADHENLRLAQTTLEAQQSSYELIRRSREAGIGSDLDLRQAQSQVEAARVDVARYSAQAETDRNALNLLVGIPVPADLLPLQLAAVSPVKEISAGVPSTVLLRRPDILSAEHQLRAAYANIGAARAAFFPRIALTASAGFLSGDLSGLFKDNAKTWNFVPQVGLPIFDAGARRANLRVANVDRETALAEYERTIQSAFREVSDSLTLRTRLAEQEASQQALVDALDHTYRLSEARYKAGIDSYLSVLVAQRSLYAAQQGLVNLRMAKLANTVTLYKVLGGGA
ncbi:MAG TPA: efflux transporter outer membrane subunit [Terriglobales bacterium]|nr:efflux transporter outer membrane subunit [Terriglobales bacterium]